MFDRGAQIGGAHAVFVQHVQRIATPGHVDLGNRAPGSADEKEPVALFAEFLLHGGECVADMGLAPLLAALEIGRLEGSEWRGDARADGAAVDRREFHRRAAYIAHETVGPWPAQKHALRRKPRLFAPVDDPELEAGFPLDLGAEIGTVLGVADRCRGHGDQRAGIHAIGQHLEAAQGLDRALASFGVEPPGFGHAGAEGAHDLFVVEIGRAARRAVKHHEADGVGADIDHAHPAKRAGRVAIEERAAERPAIGFRRIVGAVHIRPSLVRPLYATGARAGQSPVWVSFGTSDAPAEPRPDSDGFSMKKRWQLKANSPSGLTSREKVPSGAMTQVCASSAMLAAMIWLTICALTVGLVVSTSVSTRRLRLRPIQSADEMNTRAFLEGNPAPLPKHTMRECSRKRPTMDFTRIFDDNPLMPGRSPQMPRTTRSIRTPASEAA